MQHYFIIAQLDSLCCKFNCCKMP